jgi:hypothetical protein
MRRDGIFREPPDDLLCLDLDLVRFALTH